MNKPTRHRETRTILAISLPLIAAYVAEMGMMITDMIIVGRLGSNELAAVGLTADFFYVLLLLGMGVVSIVGVLVAQNFGADNKAGITDAVEQGVIAATIMSIPVMLLVWYLGPVLEYAKQDKEVIRLITDYSRPLTWTVLPALWFVVFRNFVTALAKSSVIMTITIVALLLNLALNYTLVFGKFGFPALGVVGAAYGTTLVHWLIFLFLAVNVCTSERFADYQIAIIPRRINYKTLKEIFVLGLPVTVTQMLAGTMFTFAAILVGTISADVLAAQMIIYSVIYLAFSIPVALGDAVRVRIAYGIGIFFDVTDMVNTSVLGLSLGLSVYAGWFLFFDGVLIVAANAIRGLRDTRSPLWISMIGYWVIGLGVGAWLCFPLGYGVIGLWWALIFGSVFGNVLMFWRFYVRLAQVEDRL